MVPMFQVPMTDEIPLPRNKLKECGEFHQSGKEKPPFLSPLNSSDPIPKHKNTQKVLDKTLAFT